MISLISNEGCTTPPLHYHSGLISRAHLFTLFYIRLVFFGHVQVAGEQNNAMTASKEFMDAQYISAVVATFIFLSATAWNNLVTPPA